MSSPPLPFLDAIRQRGSAPPSANRPDKPAHSTTPSTPQQQASEKSAPKARPVISHTPKPVKPDGTNNAAAQSPATSALLAAIRNGTPLKPAGSTAKAKKPSEPSKAPIARVPTQTPHLNSPQPLARSRTKSNIPHAKTSEPQVRQPAPTPVEPIRASPPPPPPPPPPQSLSRSSPSFAHKEPSRDTPPTSQRSTTQSPPSARSVGPPLISEPKRITTPPTAAPRGDKIATNKQTATPASARVAQAGLQLHKSGKYQVIVDAQKLRVAFQRLTCKYA